MTTDADAKPSSDTIKARRRRLAEALEAGEYRQHQGYWRDERGGRVCVLGAAYLQLLQETGRYDYVNRGVSLPLDIYVASMGTVHRSVGRYYGLGFIARWRLIHLNDHQQWPLDRLGRKLEAMPVPAGNPIASVIRRVRHTLRWTLHRNSPAAA